MWLKNSLPKNQKQNKREIGGSGEQSALEFLQKQGYSILQQNFSCKIGEIDIIAIDPSTSSGQVLCFIEVKARWSNRYGLPEEAITPHKIYKIRKTGEYYCLFHPELPKSLRIDAVCIDDNGIRLIKNISGM